MELISDEELVRILVEDNGEKLVDVKELCPGIAVKIISYGGLVDIIKEGRKIGLDACLVREGAAKRLCAAQSSLPDGYRLMLRCGHRSLAIQKIIYDNMYRKVKKRNPDWGDDMVKEETNRWVAPIDADFPGYIPPHSTGGAVDISIIGPGRRQLDMGTRLGKFGEESYTDSEKISSAARKNRNLLVSAMSGAGFVNYPLEWWHWSYGDRYWAAFLKKEHSIYGSV